MNIEELQTAVNRWDTPMSIEELLPHAEDIVLFIEATRLAADGKPIQWCETHEASGAEKCWAFVYGNAANDPLDADCRMVERILITSLGDTDGH